MDVAFPNKIRGQFGGVHEVCLFAEAASRCHAFGASVFFDDQPDMGWNTRLHFWGWMEQVHLVHGAWGRKEIEKIGSTETFYDKMEEEQTSPLTNLLYSFWSHQQKDKSVPFRGWR